MVTFSLIVKKNIISDEKLLMKGTLPISEVFFTNSVLHKEVKLLDTKDEQKGFITIGIQYVGETRSRGAWEYFTHVAEMIKYQSEIANTNNIDSF